MTGEPATPPANPDQPRARRDPQRRRHHTEMLVVSLLVVIAAFVLKVGAGPEQGIVHIAGTRLRLPPLCMSKSLLNIECPGCGLTRSFVCLAHGDVQQSITMNRVGWFVALALLVQIPYRVLALSRHQVFPLGVWVPRIAGGLVIAALVGSWLLRQFGV